MKNPLFLAALLLPAGAIAGQFAAEAPRAEVPTLNVALPLSAAAGLPSAALPAGGVPDMAAPMPLNAAPAARAQVQALSAGLSAAEQGNQSPKEPLDQAFERSVRESAGEAVPAAAPSNQPAQPSLAPSQEGRPPAPQPPAPQGPRTFWQKHGDTIKGATLGTIILAASTLILGAKSLEIPAFVGLLTGLLPYLRSVRPDGKAGDFLPGYVQSIIGGGLGLAFGWGMSHFGYSTLMAGYGLMAGVFVPQFIASVRKPTSDILPLGQMIGSALAGMVVGGTLPLWLGAKLGRKIGQRQNAAK